MCAAHRDRIERLKRLEGLLPLGAVPESCPDGVQMLRVLGDAYGDGTPAARLRALQRDLRELVKEGRIEAVNPAGKPLRYRRLAADCDEAPEVWAYALAQIRDLVATALPERRLDRLWQRLLTDPAGPHLDETRLRIVPDTLRLRPVALREGVLTAVIEALAQPCALEVLYQDARGQRGTANLHPQALVQRGPIPYLFALKNDEDEPLRLYALHRMIKARALPDQAARAAPGFDLDQAIRAGKVDFGQGDLIDLELRVRGYLADLLLVCELAEGQQVEDEPEGADFDLRVRARVPSTGQLLRWLLGAGDNLEVVTPRDLRHMVAVQAAKAAALYANDTGDAPGSG